MLQDFKFAVRALAKNPAFTIIALLCLSLGIGATTSIFSIVNAVLLRSLPYGDPGRLVLVQEMPVDRPGEFWGACVPNYLTWREQNRSFEETGATHTTVPVNITATGTPERVDAQIVTASLFNVLGVDPILGRTFLSEEDRDGADPTIILSFGLWQRRFGGDPDVIGKTLPIDGQPQTIVGVMPAGFSFLNEQAELWRPFRWRSAETQSVTRYIVVAARLKAGVSPEMAQAEMDTIAKQLEKDYPERNRKMGVKLQDVHDALVGGLRTRLLLLFGAVVFVLLIACVNVANLLLARAVARQKEIAIRTTVGASRVRLVRQLLIESVVLSSAGGILGFAISFWTMGYLRTILPTELPRLRETTVDFNVLGFTLIVAIATGLLFGLAPAVFASGTDLNESLKESARVTRGPVGARLRNLLVVSEVALSLLLLIGAGLMINSFLRLQKINPGFDPKNLMSFKIALPRSQYAEDLGLGPQGMPMTLLSPSISRFFDEVLVKIRSMPGVESAAGITWLPMNRYWGEARDFEILGRQAAGSEGQPLWAGYNPVTSDFFETMGVPVLRGRGIEEKDTLDAEWVLVVNQTMARQYWPNQDPLGQYVRITLVADERPRQVVGIVPDVRHWRLDAKPNPEMYVSHLQQPLTYLANRRRGRLHMSYVVRTSLNPASLSASIRRMAAAVHPEQPVYDIKPMGEYLSEAVGQSRFYTLLLGIFAAVAVVLAASGIYGTVSYSVSQRTHEIGVRATLGADQRAILKLIVARGMLLTVMGIAVGLGAAFTLTRYLSSLLFEISSTDPGTFAAVSIMLTLVGLAACWIPARRASKLDPVVAIRYE